MREVVIPECVVVMEMIVMVMVIEMEVIMMMMIATHFVGRRHGGVSANETGMGRQFLWNTRKWEDGQRR